VQVAEQPSPDIVLPSSQVSGAVMTRSPQRAAQSVSVAIVAPVGQQPSAAAGVVIGLNMQAAVQVPMFASVSRVQTMPSLQLVGQAPAPLAIDVSQVSPLDTTPSPHRAGQSLSVPMLAPIGQQPSPLAGAVIGAALHEAAQVPAPVSTSAVQAIPSLQLVGQRPPPLVIAVSQASPGDRMPSPQTPVQSLSVAIVAPDGQQPSPFLGAVIGVEPQTALQVPAPISASAVHAAPSSQAVGQAPGPLAIPVSQVSPAESTPSPHAAGQSASVPIVAPDGQHPSPPTAAVIGVARHTASQLPPATSSSVVHAIPSSQAVGQEPTLPAAIAVSQSSAPVRRPSPQVPAQSLSLEASAPLGQHRSSSAGKVIGAFPHETPQPAPSRLSLVQLSPSSQDVGQAPAAPAAIAVSQTSSPVTSPSPHSS
jgi:hypothetical protein